MNTDNTSISGETIDYGPAAFLDEYDGGKVFSSIDRRGRYAYGQQPHIAQWNLARLAECLLLIDDRQADYEAALGDYPGLFESAYLARMRHKLGLADEESNDAALVGEWLMHLQDNGLDYTLAHRELADCVDGDEDDGFGEFLPRWRARIARQDGGAAGVAQRMNATNPLVIPRNHHVERAIDAAVAGDLSVFHDMRRALGAPYAVSDALSEFARPPREEERVTATFCGT